MKLEKVYSITKQLCIQLYKLLEYQIVSTGKTIVETVNKIRVGVMPA